jgi:hypothetical protein
MPQIVFRSVSDKIDHMFRILIRITALAIIWLFWIYTNDKVFLYKRPFRNNLLLSIVWNKMNALLRLEPLNNVERNTFMFLRAWQPFSDSYRCSDVHFLEHQTIKHWNKFAQFKYFLCTCDTKNKFIRPPGLHETHGSQKPQWISIRSYSCNFANYG